MTASSIETIDRLLIVSRRLAQEYEREPTSREIAKEMEISPKKVREIVKVSQLPISLAPMALTSHHSRVLLTISLFACFITCLLKLIG